MQGLFEVATVDGGLVHNGPGGQGLDEAAVVGGGVVH